MNERFPVQESTPIPGQSTSYFEAVSPAENTEESGQYSSQAEFDNKYSTPESNEADNNQPETGRGRNRNAPRGEQSRNTHNRKRAANYEAGRDNGDEDSQEQAEENQGKGKPLKEASELAFERGNESMAQQEKQRRQREYEYMEATDGGAKPEAVKQPVQNEQASTTATEPVDSETLPDESNAEVVIPTQNGPRTVRLNGTIGTNKNGERIFAIAGNGGAVAEGDFKTKGPEQNDASDSSPEQNNQNAPQTASPEGQEQQSSEQSDVQPDISVEDLLHSFDDGKDKTGKAQAAPDGETVNKQAEPETSANTKPDISTQELMRQIKNDTESRGNTQASSAGETADEESELGDQTGQENRETSASAKPGIDIDRVVRQYQQNEGMSLENARAAAVDLAARIEGGSSNNMTAELSEFPNYAANPTNTTSSNEGNINWYSNSISSADVASPKPEHTSEEADSTSGEEPNAQESSEEVNSAPKEVQGEQDDSEEETNKSKGIQKLGAFAVAGVIALGFTVGFGSPESRSNGENEKGKDKNNPEVTNNDLEMSEASMTAGIGSLTETILSHIPEEGEVEELSRGTVNELPNGEGYEVTVMPETSTEYALQMVDNTAKKIAQEELNWDLGNVSVAEPLLEVLGYNVEEMTGKIDSATSFKINEDSVKEAARKMAQSGAWKTVNNITG